VTCGSSGLEHCVRPRTRVTCHVHGGYCTGHPRVCAGGWRPVVGRTLRLGGRPPQHEPGRRHQRGHARRTPSVRTPSVRTQSFWKQRTVNPLTDPTRYNFLYSSSRPALRAAALGRQTIGVAAGPPRRPP
jgi:hypothetical protein